MGMDGPLLSRVTENSEAEPGRGICPKRRGASVARGAPCAGAPGAPCEAPEGTGCSSKTGCTRSPAFPSPGKPEQQEKLCSCPGEQREACPHLRCVREDAGMRPQRSPGGRIHRGTALSRGQEGRSSLERGAAKAKRSLRCPLRPQGALGVPNKQNNPKIAGDGRAALRRAQNQADPSHSQIRPPSLSPAALWRRGEFLSLGREEFGLGADGWGPRGPRCCRVLGAEAWAGTGL